MKKSILTGLFIAFLIYLTGAFITLTFDVSKWTQDAREISGIFMLFFIVFSVLISDK